MKKRLIALVALLLVLTLAMGGCALLTDTMPQESQPLFTKPAGYKNPLKPADYTHFRDMTYQRPDPEAFRQAYDLVCQLAQGEDAEAVMDAVYALYEEYNWFYTQYSLADLNYCRDMTDAYWEGEYDYCLAQSPAMDAALEEMYYVLAKSPCRKKLEGRRYFGPGYFDAYDGENAWDQGFTTLLEEEAALVNEYYACYSRAQEDCDPATEEFLERHGRELAQLLVELIAKRQQMAAYFGYPSYDQFAWDFYYYRDYTPGQVEDYLEQIRQELVPLYEAMPNSPWDSSYDACDEQTMLAWLREAAVNMDGDVLEAFYLLEAAGLYDLSYSPNKYDSSFEVYLSGYEEPFIFLNATETNYDCLTLAHEFGHFCNDYMSWGSYAGVDVLEVFSQGMEYLCLCYVEEDRGLTRVKMADSLCVYVEQAAFAWFEQEAYRLTGPELTVDNLCRLYGEAARRYGFGWVDPLDFVTTTHYYTNPMYIISYVVSNDAAMQFYQLELNQPGEGLARFTHELDTEEAYFLSFLEDVELESPFAPGRLQAVAETFREIFG